MKQNKDEKSNKELNRHLNANQKENKNAGDRRKIRKETNRKETKLE